MTSTFSGYNLALFFAAKQIIKIALYQMKSKTLVIIIFTAGSFFSSNAQVYESVKQLAQRRVPWLASQLLFSSIRYE